MLFALFLVTQTLAFASNDLRPFAEYEPVQTVAFSAGLDYQTAQIKRAILENLPSGVTALVYTSPQASRRDFDRELGGVGTPEILSLPFAGEALWSRDSLPYPVITAAGPELVDARYSDGFEPDEAIAARFGARLRRHAFTLEHGNFTANRLGHCIVVQDNFAALIPDTAFTEHYGCRQLTRLPFVTGIGHADEVVKFVADDLVLTNRADFKTTLETFGYRVRLLPEAPLPAELARRGVMPQRSYVNSLLVNDTVFVPVFGAVEDETALDVYRGLGLKVVPVNSTYAADYGGGALHCLTMTYPKF